MEHDALHVRGVCVSGLHHQSRPVLKQRSSNWSVFQGLFPRDV